MTSTTQTNEKQDFNLGDKVWWWTPSNSRKESGIIERIGDDYVGIWMPDDEIRCHITMTAKKRNSEWFAYEGYVGYTRLVHKQN